MSENTPGLSFEDMFSDRTPAIPAVEIEPAPRRPAARARPGRPGLRTRLSIGLAVGVLLLIVAAYMLVRQLTLLDQAVQVMRDETARLTLVLNIPGQLRELQLAALRGLPQQDAAQLADEVGGAVAALQGAHQGLEGAQLTLPEADPLRRATRDTLSGMESALSLAVQAVLDAEAGNWTAAETGIRMLNFPNRHVQQHIDELVGLSRERHLTAADQVTRLMRELISGPALLTGMVLVAGAFLMITSVRGVIRDVARLSSSAERISEGLLDARVPITREDELGQLALTFNEMAARLQITYDELEERVAERTSALQAANVALQRHAVQLEATADVSRAITSIFDVDDLLRSTVDLIRDRFGFYHAGIFLLDDTGEWAVLREATGEAGAQMIAEGHRLAVNETSMVGWTALHHQPRITLDVGEDAVRFANPLLPETRSEMTLPLMVGTHSIGVLNVQSSEEAAFDEADVQVLRSMAGQVAVAIENAQRVSEEAALLEATSPVYRAARRLATAASVDDILDTVLATVADTNVDGCLVGLFEPFGSTSPAEIRLLRSWRRDEQALAEPEAAVPVAGDRAFLDAYAKQWVATSGDSGPEPEAAEADVAGDGLRAVANFPLRAGGLPAGFFRVYQTTRRAAHEAPIPIPERLYETLSDQVSVALERALLADATRRRVEEETTLRTISDRLARAVDFDTVMQATVEELQRALGASAVRIEMGPPTGR